jgi:hypothetical protein
MSIVQTVIGAIASSGGYTPPPPTPTYTLTAAADNIDEGASLTFTANTTLVPNGTTLYWACTNTWGGGSLRFVPGLQGEFIINSNTGSFSITVSADDTTAGGEQRYSVFLYSTGYPDGQGSGGLTPAKVENILVNDTSLTPVAPFSLNFPAGNPYLLVSNTQSDWNLGTTYTIEYWSKSTSTSSPNAIQTVMSQGPDSGQIDMGYMYGNLLWSNSQSLTPEPTAAVWTHVAFVADGGGNITLYYNGVNQTTFNAGPALANGGSDLNIGRRAGVNGQGFFGKLAMIRVSTTAKYLANFSPSLSYGVEGDTRMMLGSDNPLTDLALYELNGITTVTSNGGTIYFSKATYPNLNNQIRAGDTVVDTANNQTSTVTGAVFTPNGDPDNWGVPISPGQQYGTKNFSGPGRHPISVQGAVTASMDFPSFQSLEFVENQGDYLDVAQPSYTVLGSSGAHAHYGTISNGKIFKGSYPEPQVGWILIGNSFGGPYQVTIATVTDGGATWDLTWSPQFADNLYMDENYSLYDPALAAFNLGTTWTMEFWLKANAASETAFGGIWGLLNQVGWSTTNNIVVALSDNKLVFLSVAEIANEDVRYTEPTVGQWTHVAIVNNEGTQTVWYNGVEQTKVSGTFGTASYTNGIAPLRIGRLGPQNGGTLNGKMAMVRISSIAKYTGAFTATTTYGVEADTRLFLSKVNPTVDAKNHTVTNNGVTTSTDFPT